VGGGRIAHKINLISFIDINIRMFSLFGKNTLPVTEAEMRWIEEKFLQLSGAFGNGFQKYRGFILPVKEQFPYSDLRDPKQLQSLTKQLAELLFIDSENVSIDLFNSYNPREGMPLMRIQTSTALAGHEIILRDKREHCVISINESAVNDAPKTVYLIVGRLCHYKMHLAGIEYNGAIANLVVDLAVIFFGFAVFLENVRLIKTTTARQSLGSLPIDQIAAASALYAHLSNCNYSKAVKLFHSNSAKLFRNAFRLIEKDGMLVISKEVWNNLTVQENEFVEKPGKSSVIDLNAKRFEELVKIAPHNLSHLHNLSYYRLCQGKYEEAIRGFDTCIEAKNTLAFAYNNRGYAKLMLNRLQDGHDDIEKSIEIKYSNSFAWRNLGVYYLKINQPKEAKDLFVKAFEMDSKTELIHFYLGCAYLELNYKEEARREFEHSRQISELPVQEYPELL
jgi:tetratricopeptide (TPR) repeat protein